jgi:DNA-binding MarR family transcriptional regulator
MMEARILKIDKVEKEESIRDILEMLKKLPRLISRPDLGEWCRLTVPMAQLKALFIIVNHKGVNSHTLAEDLAVTPGNVTGIVDRLAEQDLVVRKPDPRDRRVIWLEPTSKGQELLGKLIEDHSKNFAMILDFMVVEDLKALAVGLNGLVKAFQDHMTDLKEIKKGIL